jgi:hypothetical protein
MSDSAPTPKEKFGDLNAEQYELTFNGVPDNLEFEG